MKVYAVPAMPCHPTPFRTCVRSAPGFSSWPSRPPFPLPKWSQIMADRSSILGGYCFVTLSRETPRGVGFGVGVPHNRQWLLVAVGCVAPSLSLSFPPVLLTTTNKMRARRRRRTMFHRTRRMAPSLQSTQLHCSQIALRIGALGSE